MPVRWCIYRSVDDSAVAADLAFRARFHLNVAHFAHHLAESECPRSSRQSVERGFSSGAHVVVEFLEKDRVEGSLASRLSLKVRLIKGPIDPCFQS